MKSVVKACIESIQLWLCTTVYVWGLAFQAVVSFDEEPFLDRIVDCAGVLLTMAFGALLIGLTLVVVALLVKAPEPNCISKRLCKGAMIASTGYYFAWWIENWPLSESHPEIISASLFVVCLGLGSWVLLHRKQQVNLLILSNLPSLKDC